MPYYFYEFSIADYDIESIKNWVEKGIYPGSFLTAVLENDLKEAVARADLNNLRNLPAWVAYIYNEVPSACWGSPEKVRQWREDNICD